MILGFSGHGSLHRTMLDGRGVGAGKPECGFQVFEGAWEVVVVGGTGAWVAAQATPVTQAGWWPTPPPWPHEVHVVVDTQLVGITVAVLGGSVGKSPVARHRVAVWQSLPTPAPRHDTEVVEETQLMGMPVGSVVSAGGSV